MSNPDYVKYVGLTLGDFPLLALTFTKYPGHFGDVKAEYQERGQFEASADKSYGAHMQVGVGLLGLKIPSTPKSPSCVKYYGLTIADLPITAIIVKNNPAVIGDLPGEYARMQVFEETAERGRPIHTDVALGLLGIKIPLRK